MKTRSLRARFAPLARRTTWPQSSCSLWVLASLGLLSFAVPQDALAQRVIAPATLPVFRGVVSGQAVVNAPVPGATRPLLTIDQGSQRAIINWRSFDIGSDAEVLFRHQHGTAASTLNRIFDANPSLIQGRLNSEGATPGSAGGQVILINQNGIVFGRGAQVNTQSLIASTLNLDNDRFWSGVLSSGGLSTPAFQGRYNPDPEAADGTTIVMQPGVQRSGDVVIGTGGLASAAAPVLQAGAGGSIMIFAPRIDNRDGIIQAPDGQVILAAGSKAYLAFNADAQDLTLRGYVVEVEAVRDGPDLNLTSLINNAGQIGADRGNVTLAALAVNQEGRVSSTTALQANGSIYLKARTKQSEVGGVRDFIAGTINLKAGSVTEVVPDAADKSTVADSQAYLLNRGVINAEGGNIESHGTVRAAGGLINLNADSTDNPQGARVYLGAGSVTSVAGAWADVDFDKNLKTFRVTSNELKNSPDQKLGLLRGAMVTVDLRQDNNILALDGYRGAVARTVAEKAAVGGELNITSTGSVIQRQGATIDASGGGYRYDSGMANLSRLLGADGKIYEIGSAPEQLRYTQQLDNFQQKSERWGQTTNIANPLGRVGTFQDAYAEGKAGGKVTITSRAGVVLDGALKGGVTVGDRQLNKAPRGATLQINRLEGFDATAIATPGSITWQQHAADTLGAAFHANSELSAAQRETLVLGASQVFAPATQTADGRAESGFGKVELTAAGRIVLPSDVSITTDAGAELSMHARQLDIAGNIRLPGGKLTLAATSGLAQGGDNIVVRSGATLSTAGAWVNNSNADGSFVGSAAPSARLNGEGIAERVIDGGSITLSLEDDGYETRLERGSTLDVSGGASIASNQRVTAGQGGKLTVANGAADQRNPDWMQADLRGFAASKGGELTLKLARAVIEADGTTGVLPQATTRLEAGLFANHGFSNIKVEAAQGIDIAAGTAVKVEQHNLVIDPSAARQLATGGDLSQVASVQRLPDSQRAAASVALSATDKIGGAVAGAAVLTLNQGASLTTDPKGGISLSAVDGLNVHGQLSAPGGKVGLTLNGSVDPTAMASDLHLGATARISTTGVFVPTPNDSGLVQGTLSQGGAIALDARNAGVQIDAGARLDVSGVSQTVDVAAGGRTPGYVQRTLEGHAGTLVIKSQGQTALNGTLLGHGGSPAAAGGSFALEQIKPNFNLISTDQLKPAERRIVVTPGSSSVPVEAGFVDAVVNVAALEGGGFDKLRLQSENRIEFQGSTTLSFERGIRLDAPLIDLKGDAQVHLDSATVALGQSLGARQDGGSAAPSPQDPGTYLIAPGTALAPLHTRRGDGVLTVDAGAVDLYGQLTINGTSRTRLASDSDIRLIGRSPVTEGGVTRQVGSLTSAGQIELVASQVSPATLTDYTISVKDETGALTENGKISVAGNGRSPGFVYSAGGKLSMEAHTIELVGKPAGSTEQGGTLTAPQGEISLRAGSLLTLKDGSVVSVSGNGLTVPYGSMELGTWGYGQPDADGKRIELSAPTLDKQAGSTLDVRGGGDLMAVEFVAGNGGDKDITLQDDTYAIIPAANLAAMPFDPNMLLVKNPGFGFAIDDGRDAVLYDSIQIGSGGVVPAGEYVLLPARYALLPEAYLVQLQTGSAYRNLQPGQNTALLNGQTVLAGFRSARGTDIRESHSIGVVVRPGQAAVRQASDYDISGAAVFAQAAELERKAAPRAPWDAGRIAIKDATQLTLDGAFETAAGTGPAQTVGRMAEIDISGQRIAVVDQVDNSATRPVALDGFMQIEGASLSRLNGSVLLGGTRSATESGIRIDNHSAGSQVLVANTAAGAVSLPELMLTAGDKVEVLADSVLAATGAAGGSSPEVISTDTSGALVRLSSAAQTRLDRGTASAARGTVNIEAGARLSASKSLLVDGTQSTSSRGSLLAGGQLGAGGSVSLSSGQVSLGDVPQAGGTPNGLVLSGAELAAYGALDELVLRGYNAIDVFGVTTLGSQDFKQLTLDTPLLRGQAGADGRAAQAVFAARDFTLRNSSSVSAPAATGTGSLTVDAARIELGAGAKAVAGFATTDLLASDTLVVEGEGALNVASALTLETPRVLVAGGAKQTVSAVDTSQPGAPAYAQLTVTGGAMPATPMNASETELGGRLALEGRSVDVSTTVQARSGQIQVTARGAGAEDGVTLDNLAVLDARGQARNFNGTVVTADGGSVSLTAQAGRVAVDAGSKVDVSAAAEGGAAGRLAVRADTLGLGGELLGRAGASATSGSADLDLHTLADFSTLNSRLNAGGFAEERQLRLREGNIVVAATDEVAARRVTLSADSGRIDVAGTVGSGAAKGGARVNLFADAGLTLAAGSEILAHATQAGARGGEVRVATRGGDLVFDEAASIDVRAGEAGPVGSVIFGVSRDAAHVMGNARLAGTVHRRSVAGLNGDAMASVDVEATRSHDLIDGSALNIAALATEHANFVTAQTTAAATDALRASLRDEGGALADARVLGATEVKAEGDLLLNQAWDLTSAQWRAGDQPGTLTLRAQGNLRVSQSIGSPNDNIIVGDTWSLRLAAGADLAAANPLAVLALAQLPAASGSLTLEGANARLRTGTGRIDIAAGRDVRIDNVAASIYTAGRIGATDTEANGNNRWAVGGGGISIQAGGDLAGAQSAAGDLWVNQWLRRPARQSGAQIAARRTDWWSYRPRFEQGIGTLGGGDIDIVAAGDMSHIAAMLPTSGRTYLDETNTRQVDVQGGGNLNVRVGEDVVGSSFLVGRGEGFVQAAGDVGAGQATKLYLMGVSSGAVPEVAGLHVTAGGSLALQSISNPTALDLPLQLSLPPLSASASRPALIAMGPSFSTATSTSFQASTFYTYAENSVAAAVAKSGDLSYEGAQSASWRGFAGTSPIVNSKKAALPASFSLVAFDGDVSGSADRELGSTTFPSAAANVSILAGHSVRNISLVTSDRNPASVITPWTMYENAVSETRRRDGSDIQAVGGQGRIVLRIADAFSVHALEGSILSPDLSFTGPSRIRAGTDIINAKLTLQNLRADDLTEVRADTGDFRITEDARNTYGVEVRGPGRLLLQAGRNIDLGSAKVIPDTPEKTSLGGVVATGNNANGQLPDQSARITLVAGVAGPVNLVGMDAAHAEIVALNKASSDIIDLYRLLGTETDARVLGATGLADLAQIDPQKYGRFVGLDQSAPHAFGAYQNTLRAGTLPLGPTADSSAAASLYRLLNTETDLGKLQAAGSLAELAAMPGGTAYRGYVDLAQRYQRLYADYVQRRTEGALPTGVTPIVLSNALAEVVAEVARPADVKGGSIYSYKTSIQTSGASAIDLWAPDGNIVVGLASPPAGTTLGVLTTAGGAINAVLSGDFNVNQGKVITAQGGDIMLFSSQGSIDAGRGAKTSQTTPPPVRKVLRDDAGNQIGVDVVVPTGATGSGIQTLTSDPDGLGPLNTPKPGDTNLFAPAGTVDAGEAGINSGGNLFIVGTVLNASNISSGGTSSGVPVVASGSAAASLATSGTTSDSGAKAAQDAAKNAADAARAATASSMQKPNILTVEVLGFGEKNCKEQEKDCFAK